MNKLFEIPDETFSNIFELSSRSAADSEYEFDEELTQHSSCISKGTMNEEEIACRLTGKIELVPKLDLSSIMHTAKELSTDTPIHQKRLILRPKLSRANVSALEKKDKIIHKPAKKLNKTENKIND